MEYLEKILRSGIEENTITANDVGIDIISEIFGIAISLLVLKVVYTIVTRKFKDWLSKEHLLKKLKSRCSFFAILLDANGIF